MLINLSNHPSENWMVKQLDAAKKEFGSVVDLSFPVISPSASEDEIEKLSGLYLNKILEKLLIFPNENNAVHIMGEHTFIFSLVNKLLERNITCIASTTERKSVESNGKKITEFNFVRFRKYL